MCGLNKAKIQNRLLNTEDLTFHKACQIAKAMEMAERNTQEFNLTAGKESTLQGTVNKLETAKKKNTEEPICYRCKGKHYASSCKFKLAKCFNCSRIGHISHACRSKTSDQNDKSKPPLASSGNVHNVVGTGNDTPDIRYKESNEFDELGIYSIAADRPRRKRYTAELSVNGCVCEMDVDTAADFSVMSKSTYLQRFSHIPLSSSDTVLRTYTGESLEVCGEMQCEVGYEGNQYQLAILVANYNGRPTLLGKDWLSHIKLKWDEIFSLNRLTATSSPDKGQLDALLSKHSELFEEGYEGMKGFEAHITMKEGARPVFVKPRRVPYALKDAVERELDKLEKHGVIKKTERSDWASPIVVVPKADKSVRICGDYKVTINQFVEDEQYPLATTQDLYAALAGSKVFSKLDLSHAYAQLSVDEESKAYLTINTHKGLYSYTKLPYGVKSSPKLFQAKMDQILQGVEKCVCKQDDILIGGDDWQENLEILSEVLGRLAKHNVHLKLPKCEFLKPEVVYLGFRINAEGLHPVQEKVAAVMRAPVPTNVNELRSFLGMVQYYHSFLPGLATTLAPLHNLLKKDTPWEWTAECQHSYEACKQGLTSEALLVHYDLNRSLKLACDASSYGLGAVISHVMDDGQERPIAYASRTLSSSEKNYAQIEREALSIIFGVKKFHQYLYGRKFTLVTDHKPLLSILGPKSAIPTLAASRMQRWAIVLSAYDYEIEYRCSQDHSNCDALSRLPHEESVVGSEGAVYNVSAFDEDFPLTAKEIAQQTQLDPVLSRVLQLVMSGWPEVCDDKNLGPYFSRRLELSCEQNCVLWGSRVVIPPRSRKKMLEELHWEHPGMCGMKAIARTCVWWPKMDEQIEEACRVCSVCQSVRSGPPSAPLIPWKWPTRPFQRIHVDFCQDGNDYFLVVIDSHSKWIDVHHMTTTTAMRTIDELRLIFASHGLPEELVSDNGPQFVSFEFAEFVRKNGIKHTLVPPYHPQSNGAAERAVRVVKEALLKQVIQGTKGMSMKHRLANFLFRYRTTPHTTTGMTPAELMVKRQLRTRLSLVKPDLAKVIEDKQLAQKFYKDLKCGKERQLERCDRVRVRNTRAHTKRDKWIPGTVVKVCGPRTYIVRTGHKTRYVHTDHLIQAHDDVPDDVSEPDVTVPESCEQVGTASEASIPSDGVSQPVASISDHNVTHVEPQESSGTQTPVLRRSQRIRKPVDKLDI